MTDTQKRALASLLLRHASNILEHYPMPDDPQLEGLEGVPVNEVKDQLAIWLKSLPGIGNWNL